MSHLDNVRGKAFAFAIDCRVGYSFVEEHDVALVGKSVRRGVFHFMLQNVKYDGVALIQEASIAGRYAVVDFAFGFQKGFAPDAEKIIRSFVVRSPKKDRLRFNIYRREFIAAVCYYRGRNLSNIRLNANLDISFQEGEFIIISSVFVTVKK